MRGVLARVAQFSNTNTSTNTNSISNSNSDTNTEDMQGNTYRSSIGNSKNDTYNNNSNSNIGNSAINGNGNSAFTNSFKSNQDNLVHQLQREKSILENRVRLLEEERNTESGSKIPSISPAQSNANGGEFNMDKNQ